MVYFCHTEQRRGAVREFPGLNGIDFLEVFDDPQLPDEQRQRTLFVHFIKSLTSCVLSKQNIIIEGGERIRDVVVSGDPVIGVGDQAHVLTINVNKPGDFSTYTLRLVTSPDDHLPPTGFDPQLSSIDFSFKVNCPSDFDCLSRRVCPPESKEQRDIDYLAKDYGSFRQLMLDRMSVLMPEWTERNPADLGIALVELLAYVGDYLSYQQDAVATEAYIGTARKRVSVRRHARLVDYFMHDGCNARVWVQISANADGVKASKGSQLLTQTSTNSTCILPNSPEYGKAMSQNPEVFETMHDITLFQEHKEISFYTWGDRNCCLPQNATRATLRGHLKNLKAGDMLVFVEKKGARSGEIEDADQTRRHAVRLKHVTLSQDLLGGRFKDEPDNNPVPVTEIQWCAEDSLPFSFCISDVTDKAHGSTYQDDVSIALGNIVLADHGMTIKKESIGAVPEPKLFLSPISADDSSKRPEPDPVPPRFRPCLRKRPLTHSVPYVQKEILSFPMNALMEALYTTDLDNRTLPGDLRQRFKNLGIEFSSPYSIQGNTDEWSISDGKTAYVIRKRGSRLTVSKLPKAAYTQFHMSATNALPAITLESKLKLNNGINTDTWTPQRDLLSSHPEDTHFVVEVESGGSAFLRFGESQHGSRPKPETGFTATYRVGNGPAGNLGAKTIAHIVTDVSDIEKVWNPLSAQGGAEPESVEHVRQAAPYAFRTQERAVTPEDYAEVAQRHQEVQKAVATFRWTGSWRTVFVTIDRFGGLSVDEDFKKEMRDYLEKYRMAGYDLEIDSPQYVSLEIEMSVCVKPDYFRSDVEETLLQVLSNRSLPDGRKGIFHPDNFTFGQTVYLSPVYAATNAVDGVASVLIAKFQRQGIESKEALTDMKMLLGRLEIARLDNDPNFPEHGVLRLTVEGGK